MYKRQFVALWQSMLMMKWTTEDAVETLETTHDRRYIKTDINSSFHTSSIPGERLLKYTHSVTINAPNPKSTSLPNNALAVSKRLTDPLKLEASFLQSHSFSPINFLQ